MGQRWQFLTRIFRSRYVLYLEQENERLRSQVLAMTDSLLSHAGMPTISTRVTRPLAPIQGRMMPSQQRAAFEIQDRKLIVEEEADARPKT